MRGILPTAQSVSDLPGYSDPYKKATPLPFGMHSRAWGDPEWITAHPIPSPNQTLCCGVWLPQNTVGPYPSPGPWLRISHFGKVPDTQCRACASVQPALDSALDLLPAPCEPHPAPPEPPPAPLAHAGHLTSAQTRRPRGAPRPMGPAAPPVTRSPTALILMPPRQLAAVPGGAPRPGPARLRGGKAAAVRGRHRRRAPPSHPRGAGRRHRHTPAPTAGGQGCGGRDPPHLEAAGAPKPPGKEGAGRAGGGARRKAGGGSGLASPGAPQPGGAGSVPASPAAAARGCAVRHLPGGSTPAKGTRCGRGAGGSSSFCCRK